jgi:hypothetical protein
MRRQDETGDQADHASRPRFSLRHSPRPRRRSASRMILRGLATLLAVVLARGFKVVGAVGDAARSDYLSTVIEYRGPAELAAAQTLAKLFGNVKLQQDPNLKNATLHLILGSTFTRLKAANANSAISNLAKPTAG